MYRLYCSDSRQTFWAQAAYERKGVLQLFYKAVLAAKIAVYIGAVMILMCGGLGLLSHYYSSSGSEEVEAALEMQALKAGEFIEIQLQISLSILEAIAARPEIKSMDWEQQRPVSESEDKRMSDFLAWDNRPPRVAGYNDGTTGNLADRDYVIRALIDVRFRCTCQPHHQRSCLDVCCPHQGQQPGCRSCSGPKRCRGPQ